MTSTKNWHNIIMNVENANLDKQSLENKIKKYNKRAYKEELDREIEMKKNQYYAKNKQKIRERAEATKLAQIQNMAKIKQKFIKAQIQKKYGEENLSLIQIQQRIQNIKSEQERATIQRFLEHPFIKLIDQEARRKQQLKRKFIKQNEINHLQEELKNQMKNTIRFRQAQQKNRFIDYVEQAHEKRSQQRQRFKNKYLKIKKGQYEESNQLQNNLSTLSNAQNTNRQLNNEIANTSVQKMYINYLNNQMKSNQEKKKRQKSQILDDQRLSKFYQNNQQPDSSPAYLGRNPLSYERRRQLYYINKHLNVTHERSMTTDVKKQYQERQSSMLNAPVNFNQYNKLAQQMNPEGINTNNKPKNFLNSQSYQNHSQSAIIRPVSYQLYNNKLPYSQKIIKSQQNHHKKRNYLFGDKQQLNPTNIQNQKIESHRRIKSQLTEQKTQKRQVPLNSYNSQNYSENLPQPQRYQQNRYRSNYSVKTESAPNRPKREYLKYDVLTGKYVKCLF